MSGGFHSPNLTASWLESTGIVGNHPAFLNVVARLRIAAQTDATVLVTGETGTGKELAAHAIHYGSRRHARPFIAVNCGAFQDSLLENELFGHDRGAFTDAREAKPGLIAQSNLGTLFLDEIATLSPRGQVTLLRVLQERKYRPIGSSRELAADLRLVAATNVSLERLVAEGKFRSDLYYRLCVFTIELPPLRERRSDIVLLARHLIRRHAPPGRTVTLSAAAEQALTRYDWPGNVRELENAVIRAMLLMEGELIDVTELTSLGPSIHGATPASSAHALKPFNAAKLDVIRSFERQYLSTAMQENNGNISRAARAIGKERRELGRLLKKYALCPSEFRK
jgi:DNA-binding NtrC family response regulator